MGGPSSVSERTCLPAARMAHSRVPAHEGPEAEWQTRGLRFDAVVASGPRTSVRPHHWGECRSTEQDLGQACSERRAHGQGPVSEVLEAF